MSESPQDIATEIVNRHFAAMSEAISDIPGLKPPPSRF